MCLHRASLISLLAAVLLAGCNDDTAPADQPFGAAPANAALTIVANGGAGTGGAVGNGGGGGSLEIITRGNIFIGLNPAPLPPPLPTTPTTGTPVPSWANDQTISTGNAIVNGDITAAASDTTCTLNVPNGDLIINGTISCAANLTFHVGGTVFLNGTVRTGRVDGVASGENGGNFFVFAQRFIFTGSIDTRGEDNPAGNGGWGGSVNICTDDDDTAAGTGQTSQLYVGGSLNLSGGTAAGLNARGGVGGNFQTSQNRFLEDGGHFSGAADGMVHMCGTDINVSGGSAIGSGKVMGGSAGFMYWMGDAGFLFNGTVYGNGGSATSSDGEAWGAAGSAIFVQEFTIGDSGPIAVYGSLGISGGNAQSANGAKVIGGHSGFLYLINGTDLNFGAGSISLRGGDSTARGGEGGWVKMSTPNTAGDIFLNSHFDVSTGNGGTRQMVGIAGAITITSEIGDIHVGGSMTLNGGSGSGDAQTNGPAAGGIVTISAGTGDMTDAGSITFVGSIVANGGSDSNAADPTNGAPAGRVDFVCNNPAGSIYLDPESSIQLDGGNGTVGGLGGVVSLRTSGGSASAGTYGGNVHLRGAIAARGGANNGSGGRVSVLSDGPLIAAGGGDGRGGHITLHEGATIDVSGGGGGGDALRPSVTFDADGANSNSPDENGIVLNLGVITARGGAPDGNGGSVVFDGLNQFLNVGPDPGSLDLAGAAGNNGGFTGE